MGQTNTPLADKVPPELVDVGICAGDTDNPSTHLGTVEKMDENLSVSSDELHGVLSIIKTNWDSKVNPPSILLE